MRHKVGDCGVCTFAMGVGTDYDTALKFLYEKVFKDPNRPIDQQILQVKEMKLALKLWGLPYAYLRVNGLTWSNFQGETCLLIVRASGFNFHWIVYRPQEDKILDPDSKLTGDPDRIRYHPIADKFRYFSIGYKVPDLWF
jgi:hypothetical protein